MPSQRLVQRPPYKVAEYPYNSEKNAALFRLIEKIRRGSTGCWLWTGHIGKFGYGGFRYKGKPMPAHRAAYLLLVGPIPPRLQLDHICRVRRCVNPLHLDVVTAKENTRRGRSPASRNGHKRRCKRGHPFTLENTRLKMFHGRVYRNCRKCLWLEWRRKNYRRKQLLLAVKHD